MKTTLLLSSLTLIRGGLESIAAGFARGLAQRGHHVTCVSGRYPGHPLPADLAALPVQWLRLPCLRAPRSLPAATALKLQSLSFIAACRLSPAARRLLAHSDVTLSFLEVETVLLSRWRQRQQRPHVSYFPGGIDWRWLQRDRSTLRLAISHSVARAYEGQLHLDGVVTPGVNAALLQQPYELRPHVRRLLFTGRLEANKGVHDLLHIFTTLAPRFPHLTLTVLGDGPLRPELEATVHHAGLSDRVHFRGAVPPQQVWQYLQQSDLFLFPTHYESFGLAVVEAQMAGLPVVCSDIPALREVTANTALLLPPQQPSQWLDPITTHQNHPPPPPPKFTPGPPQPPPLPGGQGHRRPRAMATADGGR